MNYFECHFVHFYIVAIFHNEYIVFYHFIKKKKL